MGTLPLLILIGLPLAQITLDLLSEDRKNLIRTFLNIYNSDKFNKIKVFTYMLTLGLFVQPQAVFYAFLHLGVMSAITLVLLNKLGAIASFIPNRFRGGFTTVLKMLIPALTVYLYTTMFLNPFSATLALSLALAVPTLFAKTVLFTNEANYQVVKQSFLGIGQALNTLFSRESLRPTVGIRNIGNLLRAVKNCVVTFCNNVNSDKLAPMIVGYTLLAKSSGMLLTIAAYLPSTYLILCSTVLLSAAINPNDPLMILRYIKEKSPAVLELAKDSLRDIVEFFSQQREGGGHAAGHERRPHNGPGASSAAGSVPDIARPGNAARPRPMGAPKF